MRTVYARTYYATYDAAYRPGPGGGLQHDVDVDMNFIHIMIKVCSCKILYVIFV